MADDKGISSKLATFEEYQTLLEDRPAKFESAEEVGYEPALSHSVHRCGTCFHFFSNPLSGATVCEILRPPDEQIKPDFKYVYWTLGNGAWPLLKE